MKGLVGLLHSFEQEIAVIYTFLVKNLLPAQNYLTQFWGQLECSNYFI